MEDDLAGFQTFAVTVETERVEAPTGDPVMVGNLEADPDMNAGEAGASPALCLRNDPPGLSSLAA